MDDNVGAQNDEIGFLGNVFCVACWCAALFGLLMCFAGAIVFWFVWLFWLVL